MKFFNRKYRSLIIILLSLSLTGCGPALNPYHENFKCRTPEDDGRCVDTQTAYREATSITELASGDQDAANTSLPGKDLQAARLQRLAELLKEPKAPLLEPPKVLRVLILPYKGEGQELFMARYAYLKVDEAQWVLTGVTADEAM